MPRQVVLVVAKRENHTSHRTAPNTMTASIAPESTNHTGRTIHQPAMLRGSSRSGASMPMPIITVMAGTCHR